MSATSGCHFLQIPGPTNVPEFIPCDWRHGADPAQIETRLGAVAKHAIKAMCVVHNETSTGVTSRIHEVRKAIDRA